MQPSLRTSGLDLVFAKLEGSSESLAGLVKTGAAFLIQWIWARAPEAAFLTGEANETCPGTTF